MSTLSIALYVIAGIFAAALVDSILSRRKTQLKSTSKRRLGEMAARLHDSDSEADLGTILRRAEEKSEAPLATGLDKLPLYHRASLLLYRAGIETPVWKFGAFSVLLGSVAAWVTSMIFFRIDTALSAGFAAALIPWAFAVLRKRKRMTAFELQLPEALDLMCRGLRAGHGFTSGLQMVSQELDEPIAPEFAHVADEIALGLDTRDALKNLTHRIDVDDLHFMSTAILIQRETGGNLAEVMGRLAHVIRERHNFYGKARAMTAQNRGAALILLAMPVLFIVLMHLRDPSFVAPLYSTPAGQMLAMITSGMTLGGYILARRLAVVEA